VPIIATRIYRIPDLRRRAALLSLIQQSARRGKPPRAWVASPDDILMTPLRPAGAAEAETSQDIGAAGHDVAMIRRETVYLQLSS
jgi:hypothetical protein